jgi:hypothetical protein
MFPRDRDPAAVAALRALLRADGWHAARAALRQAEAEEAPPGLRHAGDPADARPERPGPSAGRVFPLPTVPPVRRIDDTKRGPVTKRVSSEAARADPG